MRQKILLVLQVLLVIFIPLGIRSTLGGEYVWQGHINPFLSGFVYVLDLLWWGMILTLLVLPKKKITRLELSAWLILLGFVFWLLWQIADSGYFVPTFLKSTRLIGVLLGVMLVLSLKKLKVDWLTNVWMGCAGIVSLVAIGQFWRQSSFGWARVGEAVLSASMSGVAKVDLWDTKIVRAYALFAHPNILAYYLFLTILVGGLLLGAFGNNSKRIVGWLFVIGSLVSMMLDHYLWTDSQAIYAFVLFSIVWFGASKNSHISALLTKILYIILFLCAVALVITFSRVGLLFGCLIITRYVWYRVRVWRQKYLTMVFAKFVGLLVLGVGLSFLSNLARVPAVVSLTDQALKNRILYLQRFWEMFHNRPFLGVGLGTYVLELPDRLVYWQYEPVHNVICLALAEIGIFGVALLVIWGYLMYKVKNT
jgi:hypothetical protein